MPFIGPSAAFFIAAWIVSLVIAFSVSRVRSTSETSIVGTRTAWSLVYEWMVVMRPRFTPKLSCRTFATGARQLVVHEPFDTMWWFFGSYLSSFTPSTSVASWPLAGALMMTFFAPALTWAAAFSLSVKRPVHSRTMSTPRAFHGSSFGSFTARTWMSLPPTVMAASLELMVAALNVRWTLSYLRRCASVFGSVRS